MISEASLRLEPFEALDRTTEETSFVTEEKEDDLTIVRIKKFNFRPMTRDKKQAIIQLCDETAKNAAKALLCQDGDGLTFWGGGDII